MVQKCASETVEDVIAAQPEWNRAVVEAKVKGQRQIDPKAVEETIMSNGPLDVEAETKELKIPTYIIGGDPSAGSLFSSLGFHFTAENKIAFTCLPGTGHNPHRDKPSEVLSLLIEWIGRTDS
jgi:pimeloyl-ACP methyl ester carboxylesterase